LSRLRKQAEKNIQSGMFDTNMRNIEDAVFKYLKDYLEKKSNEIDFKYDDGVFNLVQNYSLFDDLKEKITEVVTIADDIVDEWEFNTKNSMEDDQE
jgi:hypothetical protein